MNGAAGKILWVDLTQGTCTIEIIPEIVYQQVLSGMGLAAYVLLNRIPTGADPLGPENVLGFVSGLLTGTGASFSGRWMAAARSPLTGTWGDANCGGTLALAIKQCGVDGIFFTGASERPVILVVDDGRAELQDASALWGKDAIETERLILSEHLGEQFSVACIGMAGEKLSLMAGIVNDRGRMAARSGLGAVMGSKKLKAVALRGNFPVSVANPAALAELTTSANRWARFQPPFLPGWMMPFLGGLMRVLPLQMAMDGLLYKTLLRKWGTIGMNQMGVEMGDAPIQNWRGSSRDYGVRRSAAVNPDRIIARQTLRYHCAACPLGCGGISEPFAGTEMHKPEYETVHAWGGLLLNNDLESIYRVNDLLNRAGMDSISAGATVAFAIECFEKGLLTREDTGGLDLRWGEPSAILALADKMVRREGIGDLLADGSRRAADRIGHGADRFAIHAGGQELAMHDGRNDPGFALHAVVEPTPGRHTLGSQLYYEMFALWTRVEGLPHIPRFYPKRNRYLADDTHARMAAACSQFTALINGAGICLFGAFLGVQRIPVFEWLNAVTGWQKSPVEYMRIGWTIQSMRQAFNARQGMPLRHSIPGRPIGNPPLIEGANRGRMLELDGMVQAYWSAMDWDPLTGMPPMERLTLLAH